MVIGHYVFDGRNTRLLRGIEELILNEDGTFIQLYTPPGAGPVQAHTGRWEFHERERWVGFSGPS